MPPEYRVDLADLGTAGLGTVILDDILGRTGAPVEALKALKITRGLNGARGIELALPPYAAEVTQDNFDEGARELHVYRDDVLVEGYRLWKSNLESRGVKRFYGQGFYSSLRKREITTKKLYLPNDPATGNPVISSDQVNIAWDLIAYTQAKTNGGLGITRVGTDAANATGIRRHAAYCSWELRKVADAIEELASALNGFDFDVDENKVWRTWYPRRGASVGVVLDASLNIGELGLVVDAFEDTATTFRGLGPCETCDGHTKVLNASDAAGLARYGLLEESEQWPVKDQDHLQDLTDEQLRLRKAALYQPAFTVIDSSGAVWGTDYDVGDTLTVTSTEADLSGAFRVQTISVEIGPGGDEDVSVTVDQALT